MQARYLGSVWGVMACLVFAIGILLTPETQASGLDQAMQQTFGSMVNQTNPGYSASADRSVLTGGQLVIKNRITNTNLFSYQAPYLHAGCGGWDAFGGSFSFISSAQIVAMLRSIASNALSYAFTIAILSISPDMGQTMKSIGQEMDKLNNASINSCKTGMAIVDAVTGHPGPQLADIMGQFYNSDSGKKEDPAQASNAGGAQSPSAEVDASPTTPPAVRDAIIPGNAVWSALQQQDVSNWFPTGDTDTVMLQQLMSLTGTVITCVPGSDVGCQQNTPVDPNAQKTSVSYTKIHTLSFENIVEGSVNGTPLQIYHCDTTTSPSNAAADVSSTMVCLNPVPVANTSFIGIKQVLIQTLLQGACADYVTPGCGLVGRYAANTHDVTDSDRKLRVLLGDPLKKILDMSRYDESAARTNVELLVPKMASDLAYATVESALLRAAASVSAYKGGDPKTGALLTESLSRLELERAQYERAHEVSMAQIEYLNQLNNAVSKANINILPPAAN